MPGAGAARKKIEAAPSAEEPEQTPLFRPEVLQHRQTKWLGAVLLRPRPSQKVSAAVALALTAAVLAFVFIGTFTRKARIKGWLAPQAGVIKVHAPQAGVIADLKVSEGERVKKGAPLLVVSSEVDSAAAQGARGRIVNQLSYRKDSVIAETQNQRALFDSQGAEVRKRLENLRSETARLGGEVKLQTERLKIADAALLRARQMRALDLVPVARLDQARQDRIDQALKLSEVERSLSALTRELHMAERDDRELPLKLKTQVGELGRNAAAIDQELADAEVRRSYVVVAPQDGVVTGIQAETGGAVGATSPVLSILPDASVLEAQMFAPSRAVGFVKPGQKVLLRYQAYPYEKFGTQGGIVASVSQAAVSPSELPPQLAGLTALYSPNDPLYRISVRLDGQSVDAYGEKKPLQAGMQVDADVMTDRRSIVEWMFEPLYSITGKWGR